MRPWGYMGNLHAFKLSALYFSEENLCLWEFFSFRKIVYHVQPTEQLLWLSCTHVSVPIRPFDLTIHCLRFQVSTLFQSSAHRWIHDGVCFHTKICFSFSLLSATQVLSLQMGEFGIGSTYTSPNWYISLLHHLLSAGHCIVIVRRNYVLVTHGS